MKGKFRKGVFIVCYRKEDEILYLVLKRKLHWRGWEFPKGGIEKGGSLRKGILREIREETGQIPVKLKKCGLSGKYKYDREFKDRPGVMWQSWVLYSCELGKENVRIDKKEHSGYKWVSFDRALKILTWPNQRKCLRVVNKRLKNA